MSDQGSPVIVALDTPDPSLALALSSKLDPALCRLKVGKELFVAAGPAVVEALQQKGFEIFLDLKFHDIPNTVAGAVRSAARLGVWMTNIHASGGRPMMEAAREALDKEAHQPWLIAVTVLTSMSVEVLQAMGVSRSMDEQVMALAGMAHAAGLDGVVCSALEADAMRRTFGYDFFRVTPGIRPAGTASGDQHRIMTPARAMAAGSSHLVIGRPVTEADDPVAVLKQILSETGVENPSMD